MEKARSLASGDLDCADTEARIAAILAGLRPEPPAYVPSLPNALTGVQRRILEAADACALARAEMDAFVLPYAARGRGAAAVLHPAFRELVAILAIHFTELTEHVDEAMHASPPVLWRPFVANERLLAGLDAGLEAERRILRSRALDRCLAEDPGFLDCLRSTRSA